LKESLQDLIEFLGDQIKELDRKYDLKI